MTSGNACELRVRRGVCALGIAVLLIAFGGRASVWALRTTEPPRIAIADFLHVASRVIELAPGIVYEPHPCTGSAYWVAEIVTPDTLQGTATRRDRWTPDAHLPAALRANESDYRTSGYDRGHLAAAANHGQPAAKDATFNLANAVPQLPAVNRGPMRWLEESLREKVRSGQSLVIVTAPTYDLHADKIYAGRLRVPSAFVKAVLVLENGYPIAASGYRIKNCVGASLELVTVDAIEEILQRDLFVALPDDIEAQLERGETP